MSVEHLSSSVVSSVKQQPASDSNFPYASAGFWMFHIALFAIELTCYLYVAVGHPPHWLGMMSYAIAYTGINLQAAAVGHQGYHHALVRSRDVNKWLGHFTFLLAGIDGKLWRLRHLRDHHSHPNTHGHDEDLDTPVFLRLAPFTPWRWYHRFQHLYVFFVYSAGTLITIFYTDFVHLKHEVIRHKAPGIRFGLISGFLIRKAAFIAIWFVLPVLLSPSLSVSWVILYFVIASIPVAWLLLPIGMAHMNEHATFYEQPNTAGFVEKQIETTIDFCPRSRLATLLYGGLNTHLAHHLFPGVASCHHDKLYEELKRQSPEVYARKIDVSFLALFQSHFRLLRQLARRH